MFMRYCGIKRLVVIALAFGLPVCDANIARAESLMEWLRNRKQNVVNVYVPPVVLTPSTDVRFPATATVTAKPVVMYSAPATPTAIRPQSITRPTILGTIESVWDTLTTPRLTLFRPVIPRNVAATGYTVQYRARTRYRSKWLQVPVTYYRPTTTVDPVTGASTSVLQACRSNSWQLQRVAVVQWVPIRILPGLPPAASTVPTTSVAMPVTTVPSGGWPTLGVSTSLIAPSILPNAQNGNHVGSGTYSNSDTGWLPSTEAQNGTVAKPRITPEEAERLREKDASSSSSETEPSDGPEIKIEGSATTSAFESNPRSDLKPIPKKPISNATNDLEGNTSPSAGQLRSPRKLVEPPQLLDPSDPVALRRQYRPVVQTSMFQEKSRRSNSVPSDHASQPTSRWSSGGWYQVNPTR